LLNHPAKKTVGMKTTKCKPATIALLNELTQNINIHLNQVKPIKLQVNSILRTVAHQKHHAHAWVIGHQLALLILQAMLPILKESGIFTKTHNFFNQFKQLCTSITKKRLSI
jgi:hypothetical protein